MRQAERAEAVVLAEGHLLQLPLLRNFLRNFCVGAPPRHAHARTITPSLPSLPHNAQYSIRLRATTPSDDPEALPREQRLHLACLIGAQQLKHLLARHHELLGLGRGKGTEDRGCDSRRLLQRQIVQAYLAHRAGRIATNNVLGAQSTTQAVRCVSEKESGSVAFFIIIFSARDMRFRR